MDKDAERVLNAYFTLENLQNMQRVFLFREDYVKKDGRGGISFHRGFFSHKILGDIHVSNINKGKLLKKAAKNTPDYQYYFDEFDRILLCVRNLDETQDVVWICRGEDADFSLGMEIQGSSNMLVIGETQFCDNRIDTYREYTFELNFCNQKNEWGTWLLDDLISAMQDGKTVDDFIGCLYDAHIEKLYYENGLLVKGQLSYDQLVDEKTQILDLEKYNFNFFYRDGILLKEAKVEEVRVPEKPRFDIPVCLEEQNFPFVLTKEDMNIIQKANQGYE